MATSDGRARRPRILVLGLHPEDRDVWWAALETEGLVVALADPGAPPMDGPCAFGYVEAEVD